MASLSENYRCMHMTRKDKILYAVNKNGFGIEVGPSYNPIVPKKEGFNVQIIDCASADELRQKYRSNSVNLNNIEDVDFVWSGQRLENLTGKTEYYDFIIASHVIEHVPDFLSFLQQCEALLRVNGVLSLAVPDKRHCFDYYQSLTTTGNILDAYTEKRIRPTAGQAFDHAANFAEYNSTASFNDRPDKLCHSMETAQNNWVRACSTEDYFDVHCWHFTPPSFGLILSDLSHLNLISFRPKYKFNTAGNEFFVSLVKGANNEEFEDKVEDRVLVLQDIELSVSRNRGTHWSLFHIKRIIRVIKIRLSIYRNWLSRKIKKDSI